MRSLILTSVLLLCWCNVIALNLPGSRVYIVTPSPRPLQIDEGRSGPYYYHNWMRRMDNDISTPNVTSATTKAATTVKTPDLIFAEFESNNMKKSIRKLLEKEKVAQHTTTTTAFRPIYVPDEEYNKVNNGINYGLPINIKPEENVENSPNTSLDYYLMYDKLNKNMSTPLTTQSLTMKPVTPTSGPEIQKVENIWHIINSEKNAQYGGNWEEVPIDSNKESVMDDQKLPVNKEKTVVRDNGEDEIDENFALPGFGSNPGNVAENESRAIRNENNIRFPYVNLKTFQLKPPRKPLNNIINHKDENNLITSLDNFHNLKNPVRGEAQDVVPKRYIIDRYNPAQPYLPPSDYGSKVSKQNSDPKPSKATAMLVPPPPSLKASDDRFPLLTNPYESFPPYFAPSFDSTPSLTPPPIPPKPPVSIYSATAVDTSDDSDANVNYDSSSDKGPPIDVQSGYLPPAPPLQDFIPTAPPVSKPFTGYSYERPPMQPEVPMVPSMEKKPDFHGYHYSIPEPTNQPYMAPSYSHNEAPPTYGYGVDYPELIFQKYHGDMDDSKETDDSHGMGPPPPMNMKPDDPGSPIDDHGFPSDFPGDFKFHDDSDYYHHHHDHTTTTTTTTEMPRVNRYSYYYLGKKLYYLPLYFSVYFIVYVGALIIKAVLRHKIVYPNSWRPNDTTATFFSKRSVDDYLSNDNLHEVTGRVTRAIANAAEKYLNHKSKTS